MIELGKILKNANHCLCLAHCIHLLLIIDATHQNKNISDSVVKCKQIITFEIICYSGWMPNREVMDKLLLWLGKTMAECELWCHCNGWGRPLPKPPNSCVFCLWPRMTIYGTHNELTCCLTLNIKRSSLDPIIADMLSVIHDNCSKYFPMI